MNTKLKRAFVTLVCCSWIVLSCFGSVYAEPSTGSAGGLSLDGDVTTTLTEITSILLLVGAGVCVGKCIHIGILYTISSAVEKSNAKQAMFPWIIGTIICFGAATIGPFVINVLSISKNVLDY